MCCRWCVKGQERKRAQADTLGRYQPGEIVNVQACSIHVRADPGAAPAAESPAEQGGGFKRMRESR